MQQKMKWNDQRGQPDTSGRRKQGQAAASRRAAAQQQGVEEDRPPPSCAFLTVDQAVSLANPVRCRHLEVKLQVQDPKPTSTQVIAILRDGLGQLRERHALSYDIVLSTEDEQRIADGGKGLSRPPYDPQGVGHPAKLTGPDSLWKNQCLSY
jgi:hypothetical protein